MNFSNGNRFYNFQKPLYQFIEGDYKTIMLNVIIPLDYFLDLLKFSRISIKKFLKALPPFLF